MDVASRIFRWASIWGFVCLGPMYFLEQRIGIDQPPAITHPEFFYGFVGVGLAWQVAFWIISRDPVRLSPLIPACVLEKLAFGVAVILLAAMRQAPGILVAFAVIDLVWGALFVYAGMRLSRFRVSGD